MLLTITVALLFAAQAAAPPSVAELEQQAEKLIEAQDFPRAEALLDQALRLDPGNANVQYRLGYVLYRQRKLAPARTALEATVEKAPPAYYSRYFLGRIALLESKPKEAIRWLEPVVGANEPVFDAAAQLAGAYSASGEPRKAISSLRAAITQTPWDGSLYYRLGQIYQRLGQPEMAREELRASARLKNLSREDVETLMQVSELLRDNKADSAVQAGAKILDRENADPNTVVALGVLYGTAKLERNALKAFEVASERDANLFQAQFNRGLALLKLNRTDDALVPLGRSVELLPQSSDANLTLGLALVMRQQYRESIGPLERVWQADSTNPRVGSLLGTAYLRTGESAKAVQVLRSVVAKHPGESAARLLMVEAQNAAGDPEGALASAKEAAEKLPALPQAHLALAQQLARAGRYQDARPAFETALRLSPGLPEAELGVADTLQKAGEHAAALSHFERARTSASTELAAILGQARSLTALRRLDEGAALLESAIGRRPPDATLHLELSRIYARSGKSDQAARQAKIAEQLKAANP